MLKYEPLMRHLRFILAALVIVGCVIAGINLARNKLTSDSFVGNFQSDQQTVSCIVPADGGTSYCVPEDQDRFLPNFGVAALVICAAFVLFSSSQPSLAQIRYELGEVKYASSVNLITQFVGW